MNRAQPSSIELSRLIIEQAVSGSLGTVSEGGSPLVTLVTVASTGAGTMAMLLSGLAKHTANLLQRPDCSLLVVQPGGEAGDPLSGARISLNGKVDRLERDQDRQAREAFLRRHPGAAMYADFEDFAFYRLTIQEGHLVAGFGRIETIPGSEL